MSAQTQLPPSQRFRTNYKLGSLYAVVTALLISVQEPFSFLAAKRLSATQFVSPDASRLADIDSVVACASKESPGSGFSAQERRRLSQVGRFVSHRNGRFAALQARTEQRPSDHHFGDHQPPTFFRGSGGAHHRQSADPCLARDLLRLPHQRVSRRDDGRLEPGRRGQPAGVGPVGRQRDPRHLALRHSGSDLLGFGRNARLQMVREIRRVRCNRGEFRRLGAPPHSGRGLSLGLARGVGFWAGGSGAADDRRHNHRRFAGSRPLSNRAQRYRQRQWLRHDVLSFDPDPHRFDLGFSIVVDCRFAFRCGLDVLCRPGCRFDLAPASFR